MPTDFEPVELQLNPVGLQLHVQLSASLEWICKSSNQEMGDGGTGSSTSTGTPTAAPQAVREEIEGKVGNETTKSSKMATETETETLLHGTSLLKCQEHALQLAMVAPDCLADEWRVRQCVPALCVTLRELLRAGREAHELRDVRRQSMLLTPILVR
jgi:hypothetical protein